MSRRLISSGSPYEPVAGFSRAVVVGRHVHVAGTAPVMPDGAPPPDSAYE
jgi:enamine deaminase RidA (YjgF/YER057c/UK114 family)